MDENGNISLKIMHQILLYLSMFDIGMTFLTMSYVYRIARFPTTPSRPYLLLTIAFALRSVALFTRLGTIGDTLQVDSISTQLATTTFVSIIIGVCFLLAFMEQYVLISKKLND